MSEGLALLLSLALILAGAPVVGWLLEQVFCRASREMVVAAREAEADRLLREAEAL